MPHCYNEVLEHDSEPDTDDDPEMPGPAHDAQDAFARRQAQNSWGATSHLRCQRCSAGSTRVWEQTHQIKE